MGLSLKREEKMREANLENMEQINKKFIWNVFVYCVHQSPRNRISPEKFRGNNHQTVSFLRAKANRDRESYWEKLQGSVPVFQTTSDVLLLLAQSIDKNFPLCWNVQLIIDTIGIQELRACDWWIR